MQFATKTPESLKLAIEKMEWALIRAEVNQEETHREIKNWEKQITDANREHAKAASEIKQRVDDLVIVLKQAKNNFLTIQPKNQPKKLKAHMTEGGNENGTANWTGGFDSTNNIASPPRRKTKTSAGNKKNDQKIKAKSDQKIQYNSPRTPPPAAAPKDDFVRHSPRSPIEEQQSQQEEIPDLQFLGRGDQMTQLPESQR